MSAMSWALVRWESASAPSSRPVQLTKCVSPMPSSAARAFIRSTKAASEPQAPELLPIKDEIAYDDFAKMDLRLGKVVACEEVKRSKKLLKLTVDIGSEQRTVVSGIKSWYKPEDLVGRTVVLVANLKPVTLCGVESHGMILCASDPEDKELAFVTPAQPLTPGWVVR